MKTCSKCKVNKSTNDFYFDKRPNRGFKSICKDCENAQKRMKRTLDWRKENQPMSLFISAFKKRFGNHESFTDEFIELYRNAIKLKSTIKNKQSAQVFILKNLVCKGCGAVQPLDFPMPLSKLNKVSDLFLKLHCKC